MYSYMTTLKKLILLKNGVLFPGVLQIITGAIASFVTKKATKAQSVSVTLEPIQDLHGYDKPWSGGNGKNKCDLSAIEIGKAWNLNTNSARATAFFPIKPNTTYTVSVSGGTFDAVFWGEVVAKGDLTNKRLYAPSSFPYTITTTAESNVGLIQFNKADVSSSDFTNVKVQVEEGTTATSFAPYTNICPISGRTEVVTSRVGKNLIPYPFRDGDRTIDGVTWTMNSDGKLNAHGTASRTSYYGMYGINSTSLSVLVPLESIGLQGGDTVTLSSNYSQYVTVQCNKEDGTLVFTGLSLDGGGSVTKTLPTTAKYVYIGLRVLNGTSINQDNIFVQLEKGSIATDYEPYQSITYTTDLGRTVYGGTLDVVSGELTNTLHEVGTDELTWTHSTTVPTRFITTLSQSSAGSGCFIMCSHLERLSSFPSTTKTGIFMNTASQIVVNIASATAESDFSDFVSDGQLVYELAAPQTYQLTPQEVELLLGQNNVWSDGNVEVRYVG